MDNLLVKTFNFILSFYYLNNNSLYLLLSTIIKRYNLKKMTN